jgi:hypothetical protein
MSSAGVGHFHAFSLFDSQREPPFRLGLKDHLVAL